MEDCAAIILCNTLRLRALHLLLSASLHFGMEQNVAIAIGHAKEGQTPLSVRAFCKTCRSAALSLQKTSYFGSCRVFAARAGATSP